MTPDKVGNVAVSLPRVVHKAAGMSERYRVLPCAAGARQRTVLDMLEPYSPRSLPLLANHRHVDLSSRMPFIAQGPTAGKCPRDHRPYPGRRRLAKPEG